MEKPEMEQIRKKAEVLIEALPYIQQFNRKIIVVKYGGSAMSDEELEKNEDYQIFAEALHFVNEALAKSVITSSLTKAAVFGHDANWGRILCALGYSGAAFDPEKIELYLESSAGKILIFKDGTAADYSEEEAERILSSSEVTALVDMKMGDAEATAWGCDLTYDYVKINADYRS